MLILGMLGGAAYARHPGLPEDALQHQRDPDQPDAGLCRAALPRLAGARSLARPARASTFPQTVQFNASADPAGDHAGCPAAPTGVSCSPWSPRWSIWFLMLEDAQGFRGQGARPEPAGRALRRLLLGAHGVLRLPGVGRAGRPCRHLGSVRRDRPAAAGRSRPATASPRSSSPSSAGSIRSASSRRAWCWR